MTLLLKVQGKALFKWKIFFVHTHFPLAACTSHRYLTLTQGSGRSSGVEHNLAKVRVGRSNRLARSNGSLRHDRGNTGFSGSQPLRDLE